MRSGQAKLASKVTIVGLDAGGNPALVLAMELHGRASKRLALVQRTMRDLIARGYEPALIA